MERLSGVWEGVSTPFSGSAPTIWTNCQLTFSALEDDKSSGGDEDEHPQRYCISGRGSSLWKKETIGFVLRGELDLASRAVLLVKQHTGRFSTSVEYRASLDDPIRGRMHGKYKNGTLVLSRRGDAVEEDAGDEEVVEFVRASPLVSLVEPELVVARTPTLHEQLSGAWQGTSVNRESGEETQWSECWLEFGEDGSLTGQGKSLWRNSSIPFDVEGTARLDLCLVKLTKAHLGRFTNRVLYSLKLSMGSSIVLRGNYDRGSLVLHRAPQLDDVLRPDVDEYETDDFSVSNPYHVCPAHSTAEDDDEDVAAPATSPTPSGDGGDAQTSTAERLYRLHLSRVVSSSMTEHDYASLRHFREQNGVTEEMHLRVLDTLRGVTEEQRRAINEALDADAALPDRSPAMPSAAQPLSSSSTQGPSSVEEAALETEDRDDRDLCIICMDRPRDTVLLPCAHLAICIDCSTRLRDCPVCRQAITEAKLVFRV